jgi:hypothetical protein
VLWAIATAVATGALLYRILKAGHDDEVLHYARRLGLMRKKSGIFEQRLGRAIVRFESEGPQRMTFALDLSPILGMRLGIRRRSLFGNKPGVTGEPLLDASFEIDDPLAAVAYIAPCADLVAQIFAETAADQTLVCERSVFVLRASRSHVLAEAEAWLTRFKTLVNLVDVDVPADVRLRRNMVGGGPGLRLRSLQLLESEFAGQASHKAAIADGLLDDDVAVRIEAARQGKDPAPLAAIASDRAIDPVLRTRAMAAHERVASKDAQVELLTELVTDPAESVSLLAITELKAHRAPGLGKRFIRLLDVAEGERLHALLDAVSVLGDSSLEAPLCDALWRLDDEGKRLLCAALAELGTVVSVPVLRQVSQEASALTGRALRSEAERAIARIQSRLAGAEAGQVSVLVAGGELSVPKRTK